MMKPASENVRQWGGEQLSTAYSHHTAISYLGFVLMKYLKLKNIATHNLYV